MNAGGRYSGEHDDSDTADAYRLHHRAGRRSRPRSKQRPAHADAVPAFVVAVDRGRYTCQLTDPAQLTDPVPTDAHPSYVTAMRARELGRRAVIVGDYVALVGDVSGATGTLARIVRLHERSSALRRSSEDGDSSERVVVANAQRLVIVVALTDPPPRTGFIDRCLVAAYDADIEPLLCLTKTDTPGSADALKKLMDYYLGANLRHVTTRYDRPVTQLAAELTGGISVLVGHSGVGKSTLVNTLIPDAQRAIGELSGVGKGRHTTTAALALSLPDGGWIIDTPGVRTFGLAHVDTQTVLASFPDLVEGSTHCPPGCRHHAGEPACGLDSWVAAGHAPAERLASLRSLIGGRG